MMAASKQWNVNRADLERVARNALIFLAPVAIVVIDILQRGGNVEEIFVAVKVWALGVALDFFRKLQASK